MDRLKILVVDDDDRWLRTIQRILASDYELKVTTEPSEALSLVKSSFFSLAILDQRISADMTGVDLFVRLRAIRPDLRAIILTGYAELDDAVGSVRTGISDYIAKGRTDLASELRARVKRALAEDPRATEFVTLIQKGESAELEFKSSARWDMRQNKVSKDLEGVIVKTVAAFLNSDGGVLLIGVDDSGKIVGLQQDYMTLKRKDRDGFENFLWTLLLDACGKDMSQLIRTDFHSIDGCDVCRVSVKPAPKPVFVSDGNRGENLYIRTGNSTRQLTTKDAIAYCKERWR